MTTARQKRNAPAWWQRQGNQPQTASNHFRRARSRCAGRYVWSSYGDNAHVTILSTVKSQNKKPCIHNFSQLVHQSSFPQRSRWEGSAKLDLRRSKTLEHPRAPHQELDHDEEEPGAPHLHLLPARHLHGPHLHLHRDRPCRPARWGGQLWDQLRWSQPECE